MRYACRLSVCGWLVALAAAALPGTSRGQDALTQSTTTGSPFLVPPVFAESRPAALPAGKIVILPFSAVNPADAQPWIGKSVQQSLVADLLASAPSRVSTADGAATTAEQAVAIGRRAGARYVVLGNFITNAQELRLTGQIIDLETGRPVSGIKATGTPDQIFRMEDALGIQIKLALMPESLPRPEFAPGAQPAQPGAQQAPADVTGQLTGLRNDVGSASPTGVYYSPYAFPPASNANPADADRYYYSNPTIYNYNTYNYAAPYDSSLYDFPYLYGSPFLGAIYGVGSGHFGQGGGFGHGQGAGRNFFHGSRRQVVVGTTTGIGIINQAPIDYAGIVSGNVTGTGNAAIVSTSGVIRPNNTNTAFPGDPPGSFRSRTMRLEFSGYSSAVAGSANIAAVRRTTPGVYNNSHVVEIGGSNNGVIAPADGRVIRGGNGVVSGANTNSAVVHIGQAPGIVGGGQSAYGGGQDLNFVPPPVSAPPPIFAPAAAPPAASAAAAPAAQGPIIRGNAGRGGNAGGRR